MFAHRGFLFFEIFVSVFGFVLSQMYVEYIDAFVLCVEYIQKMIERNKYIFLYQDL